MLWAAVYPCGLRCSRVGCGVAGEFIRMGGSVAGECNGVGCGAFVWAAVYPCGLRRGR